ncbi:MAG: WbqC family protein [Lachnospiraceae bacterium]|nr:WbqC family protein [Lachnospiraceae bacterium]
MRVAIMQPYLFPYIGYYQLMNAVDKFILLDSVNYIKKGFINRNYILVNGTKHLFTINIKNKSQNTLIKDILLDNEDENKERFLKSIYLSYKKAPYFEQIYPMITKIVNKKHERIVELILSSIYLINDYLGISTSIVPTSIGYNNGLKGQERIIDICKKEKASHYINPGGGISLYEQDLFNENGLKLSFLKTNPIKYKQYNNDFVPNLSIIDVLMFNSPETIAGFLKEYELIK